MTDCIECLTRLRRLAGVAIVGAAFLAPMPASAQSAEETVAFMLWGLEEDGRTKRLSENLWEAEGHGGDQSSFRIQRLTDCLFRVSSQVRHAGVPDVLEFDYVLDFAAVKDYSAWFANGRDRRIIVKMRVTAGTARPCAARQLAGSCMASAQATWTPTWSVAAAGSDF